MSVGCAQVEEFLASAEAASLRTPPEAIRSHLDRCGPCRKVWEFVSAQEPLEVAPQALCGRIEQQLKDSLAAVRPLPCRKTLTLAFLGIFVASAVFWVFYMGSSGARGLSAVQLAGTLSAVAAAAALAAAVLSGEMVPGEKRLGPIGLMSLLAIGGLAMLVVTIFPWERAGSPWLSAAMQCHTHGAMIAIPTAAAAFLLLRRGSALCPATAGAAIGLLAGLASMATLHLGCTMHGALHITAGHLSIPAGGAVIGYLVGKGVGRWAESSRGRSLEA